MLKTIQLSKEAKKKLRKLKTYLLSDKRKNAFDMSWWGLVSFTKDVDKIDSDELSGAAYKQLVVLKEEKPACGAVCCFAGSLCIMDKLIKPTRKDSRSELIYEMGLDTWEKAAAALGITQAESGALFLMPEERLLEDYEGLQEAYNAGDEDANSWPYEFARQYYDKDSSRGKLNVAVKYLDHVIENGLEVLEEVR